MALITTEAREDLITLAVGMFNAAPGANYLNQLVDAYEAGASIQNIADALATKPQFAELYPNLQTVEEFAASLVDNLLTDSTSDSTKEWATNWVITQMNAGATKAEVIVDAVAALRATTNENYADAQAQLANRVEVATYYSVEQQQSSKDLGELQAVIADVTSDEDSVDAAKEEIDDDAGANGETFVLEAGQESLEGTSANDTFRALSLDDVFEDFDDIDGGAGVDTFDIFTLNGKNATFPANSTVENVEIVNVYNDAGAPAAYGDASNFVGIEQLWQIGDAVAVTKLQSSTTAGFRSIDAGALSVAAAAGVSSASVAFDDVDDASSLTVTAGNTLNLTGTASDSATDGVDSIVTTFNASATATTATVNSEIDITLTQGGAKVTTLDASGSTGGITFTTATIAAIETGSGDDNVTTTVVTDKDAPVVSATVDTGDGKDTININTSGDGTTTVNSGAGDDAVTLTSDGTGILTVNLGAGSDDFSVAGGVVNATDVIDGGADEDTLLLNIVGAANIGAFQNFELFDVAGLAKTLDVDILASKNTVTEIVASADVGVGAVVQNVGAGVGYRVTDDTDVANALTLTQKTAGALTVALDIDETGAVAATTVTTDADAAVVASNATSLAVDFDSDFVGVTKGGADNTTQFAVTGDAATTLTVNSSGDNATNELVYTDTNNKLTTVTVTGDSDLTLGLDAASTKVATVDATAFTGGLTFDTARLAAETAVNEFDGGQLKLGGGDDVIDLGQGARITGVELASGEDETAQDGFDVFTGTSNTQATDNATADVDIENGLATFLGTGPATLTEAVADVTAAAGGNAAVFEYLGNSYIYAGGEVVQLVGVTGLEGLDDVGGASLYVF